MGRAQRPQGARRSAIAVQFRTCERRLQPGRFAKHGRGWALLLLRDELTIGGGTLRRTPWLSLKIFGVFLADSRFDSRFGRWKKIGTGFFRPSTLDGRGWTGMVGFDSPGPRPSALDKVLATSSRAGFGRAASG